MMLIGLNKRVKSIQLRNVNHLFVKTKYARTSESLGELTNQRYTKNFSIVYCKTNIEET